MTDLQTDCPLFAIILVLSFLSAPTCTVARKKSSPFEDLIVIASKLPWQAGVALALVSFLIFHYIASLPPPTFSAADMKNLGQSVGSGMGRQMLIGVSMFLQYIFPVAFLIGAGISAYKRHHQSALHFNVASNPTRTALETMSWREFEGLTAEVFRRKGYQVVERGGDGPDGGVDLELSAGKDKYLVQCKQWKVQKVGVTIVRELYGVMAAEGAVGGFVVASGEFTEEAERFVEGRSIELVPASTMLRLVKETSRVPQNTAPVTEITPTCPKCGSQMVKRTAKRGSNAGNTFWGCSQYPVCKGIRN